MALERIHGPLVGPKREDLRAAQIAAMIANVNRDPQKHPNPYEPDEVALRFEMPPDLSPEEERVARRRMFGVK